MFHTLAEAIAKKNEHDIVIAEDISSSGQKRFIVASAEALKARYLPITQPHWYECLLENKPSRIFLDVESGSFVDIASLLESLKKAISHKFNVEPRLEVLDSCSPTKFSWHIICTNVFLKNVYHVGAFVRRFWLATEIDAIDTVVYTKNRMFRICGSSKFGSNRVLKNSNDWHTLLVQAPCKEWFACAEIDGLEPVSCSIHPSKMFYFDGDNWHRNSHGGGGVPIQTQCPLLEPVINFIDGICGNNVYKHKTTMTDGGFMMISTKSKDCAIAARQHRGNNIWFGIDCIKRKVYQKCHDSDCKGKCHEINVPEGMWSQWNDQWSANLSSPNNENTLYNMVD